MTAPHPGLPETSPDVAGELAHEQAHVDRVYAELEKASLRAADVEADGLARGPHRPHGDVRDEEMTGLFERDALVYAAARRRSMIEKQYEGLVFGRLDLGGERSTAAEREVRYIGRLGVRDDDYEPLVVDWRAPAALGVLPRDPGRPDGCRPPPGPAVQGLHRRRRRGRPHGAEAPTDIVVLGDGALIAALTRSRGRQMRDIVATIQRDQDEAIRAPSRGVTEITGGPAPARRSSRCTARPTCSTRSGGGSRTAASSSSDRPPRTRPTSSACCRASARSRWRCVRSVTSSTA